MSSTVSGSLSLNILAREILASGIKKGVIDHSFSSLLDLPNGANDNQINRAYSKVETGIAASVTTVYDLVGSLTDGEGVTMSITEVVLIAIRNLSSTAANWLSIGPDATAGFGAMASNKGFWADASDRNTLAADGDSWLVLYSKGGVPAAAASTDELAVITQGGTSLNTWQILVLGRT